LGAAIAWSRRIGILAETAEIGAGGEVTVKDIARGLVKKKTQTLGSILPDITNPFYPEVAIGARKMGGFYE
jgi:hypothetical protein